MKILAVEDDPVAALVLEAALRSLGHEVALAADGAEAWRQFAIAPASLIISDWKMPEMDGLELCRRVRELKGDYVYFVLLTQQSATDENHQAALEAGVDDLLGKPVNVRELKMRLHVAARILDFIGHVRQLEAVIPICSYCHRVRSDQRYWQELESYLQSRAGTEFSHGICPECYERRVLPMLRSGHDAGPSAGNSP